VVRAGKVKLERGKNRRIFGLKNHEEPEEEIPARLAKVTWDVARGEVKGLWGEERRTGLFGTMNRGASSGLGVAPSKMK